MSFLIYPTIKESPYLSMLGMGGGGTGTALSGASEGIFGADGVFRKVIAQCKRITAVKSPVVSNILLKPIPPRKVKIQALSFQRKVK